MSNLSYEDTSHAVYDPYDPRYQSTESLESELNRTFDLCNSCRMCFKLCPSFPSLFEAMDSTDADVLALTEKDKTKVVEECFQCRVCYVICPYTETDKHPYKIDFPALMLRAKILAARKKGIGFRERILGDPDLLGRINSGWLSVLVNATMKSSFSRSLIHAVLGIHKKKLMPSFHKLSFARWFRKYGKKLAKRHSENNSLEKVVLFSTCFVNYNKPEIGKDAFHVLEKNNILVKHPAQNCCGMPALDSGNLKAARKKMKSNVRKLLPYVEQGYSILAINPTCSLTLKEEYARFLAPGKWRESAKKISQATKDLHEYLFELKNEGKLNHDFQSSPGKVAYHVPCHLRAQSIGFRSRDIMRLIPETSIHPIAECCGHNGTWAMKKEYFDMSLKTGKRAFENLETQDADTVASDCPLAAIQLKQGMKGDADPIHPIQIVAKAYRSPEEGGHKNKLSSKLSSRPCKDD